MIRQWWHKASRSNQQISLQSTRQYPNLTLVGWSRIWDKITYESREKQHTTALKTKQKWILMTFCNTFRSIHCSVIIRADSNKCRNLQPEIMHKVRNFETLSLKRNIPSLHRSRNHLRSRDVKNVRTRGDWGHQANKYSLISWIDSHMNSQRLRQPAQGLLGSVSDGVIEIK